MTTTETTTTNPDEYNGWTNHETWAAALHLSNDENLYDIARRLVRDADADVAEFYADQGIESPQPADTYAAADALEIWVADMVADYHDARSYHSDNLMRLMVPDVGSFWRVDWLAVADSFRD